MFCAGSCSDWDMRFDDRAELGLREAKIARRRGEGVVLRGRAHFAVELVYEKADLGITGRTNDLDDVPALRFHEKQDGSVHLARFWAVLGDVHDFLGHAPCAGGRIEYAGIVFCLVDLDDFRHGYYSSFECVITAKSARRVLPD